MNIQQSLPCWDQSPGVTCSTEVEASLSHIWYRDSARTTHSSNHRQRRKIYQSPPRASTPRKQKLNVLCCLREAQMEHAVGFAWIEFVIQPQKSQVHRSSLVSRLLFSSASFMLNCSTAPRWFVPVSFFVSVIIVLFVTDPREILWSVDTVSCAHYKTSKIEFSSVLDKQDWTEPVN